MNQAWMISTIGDGDPVGVVKALTAGEAAEVLGLTLCGDGTCEFVEEGEHAHVPTEACARLDFSTVLVPFPVFGEDTVVPMVEARAAVRLDGYPLAEKRK